MTAFRLCARRVLVSVTAGVCAAVLAGGCGLVGGPSGPRAPGPAEGVATARAAAPAAPRRATQLEEDYRTVIREVLPSVVQIDAEKGLGSGVVYDAGGHIVTNAHVVGDEKSFRVTVATGGAPLAARLVFSYPEQDLAVIRLDRPPAGLKPARFGESSQVEVGQIVLAMGSPLGLAGSVTQGIVSATGRTVSESAAGGGTGATIGNMVQTSAAINPGNSGGALVSLGGEIVGIPTLAAADPAVGSAAPGIGFAIPVSMVKNIAGQIVRTGRVTDSGRAALNITGRTVLDGEYQPAGVAVVEAAPGGAAADAGLRAGDVVTKVDSAPITTMTSLLEALAAEQPGDRVAVAYTRGGRTATAQVTLGEM
ncbi:S1C family serine protease [Streptomyces sp. ODS05-4]|uniref:S1C family serine protease n=1 Tax=Streptomyces sp. ODS05-4 TaxID=2944939 RepID=UPI00210DA84B|nr:trypsin-like peptidase domain-containing protein [Streptomyces sp. ODS05-4]